MCALYPLAKARYKWLFIIYYNGTKIVTVFKCIFEETVPKLTVNFGNRNSQGSHKN